MYKHNKRTGIPRKVWVFYEIPTNRQHRQLCCKRKMNSCMSIAYRRQKMRMAYKSQEEM